MAFQKWYQSMEERFRRGARCEVWEIAYKTPDPQFIDWIVDHNKQTNSALPPKTWAKRMLYNSRDRSDDLAETLWQEYQEFLARKQQSSVQAFFDPGLDIAKEREKTLST